MVSSAQLLSSSERALLDLCDRQYPDQSRRGLSKEGLPLFQYQREQTRLNAYLNPLPSILLTSAEYFDLQKEHSVETEDVNQEIKLHSSLGAWLSTVHKEHSVPAQELDGLNLSTRS